MKKKTIVLQKLPVTGYAAEGRALAHLEGKVIFVESAVPGDVVDVVLIKNKKDWGIGKAIKFHEYSKDRVTPFCMHFGVCGGCKWQMLPYHKQLEYKQQEVEENLKRIGKTSLPEILPIAGAEKDVYYRNKLEFSFSNKRYLLKQELASIGGNQDTGGALGYHAAGVFDKIIDIQECYLMDDVNNVIRNKARAYAMDHQLPFYDPKNHTGWLRNIIIRLTSQGLLVNIVVGYDDQVPLKQMADYLLQEVPSISTLLYTVNQKWNDSIFDLVPQVYSGDGFVFERMEDFRFKISAKSFFQTNTRQATQLYKIVRNFAGLAGNEIVYDLYCGTGSIGIFLSKGVKKIVGVDVIQEAINDAKENAILNNLQDAIFVAGDVIDVCNGEFFAIHGNPDIVVIDPPRAGIHQKLLEKLLVISAPKIIYVSCNVATQARDINGLSEKYRVQKVQPVDMFPHTHHIECVCLLELK